MLQNLCKGAKILVVDDNAAMLRLLRTLLEEKGMRVLTVQTVDAAKRALEGSTESEFDLVLSDIAMPGEDGFDLLQWIKRDHSPFFDLPVLLMTAQLPEPEYRVKCLAMGAVDYVERPNDNHELVLRVVNAVEHYRRIRSLEMSLQDSEKLAMVGRLLAASNHEIKNLVTLVRIASEQINTSHCAFTGEQRHAINALEQASSLLLQVTKSSSALLNPEPSSCHVIDLVAVVSDVTELLAKRIQPMALQFEDSGPIWVLGQEVAIKQILINFILNAFDATQELGFDRNGIIKIKFEVHHQLKKAFLYVTDQGIGLRRSGEVADFKAFATTKKLRGGSGLGLWLSSNLAKHMGGDLSLFSEGPGTGATAKLSLSLAEKPLLQSEINLSDYLIDIAPL